MLLTLKKKQKKTASEDGQITVITPSAETEGVPEKEKVPVPMQSECEMDWLPG